MKIVAFLQNQWFRDPERMKKIREFPEWKNRPRWEWNATWLFWGCLTGRRLQQVFGEELCDQIYWEEISPEVGGCSSSVFPPDFLHIQNVIVEHQPTHILAFGVHASTALNMVCNSLPYIVKLICGPHPAARHGQVVQQLHEMKAKLYAD